MLESSRKTGVADYTGMTREARKAIGAFPKYNLISILVAVDDLCGLGNIGRSGRKRARNLGLLRLIFPLLRNCGHRREEKDHSNRDDSLHGASLEEFAKCRIVRCQPVLEMTAYAPHERPQVAVRRR
jgi:hypothetical protein